MFVSIDAANVALIERQTSAIIKTGYQEIDWFKEKRKLKQFYEGLEQLLDQITDALDLIDNDNEPLQRRLRVQENRVKSEQKNVRRNLRRFK